MQNFINTLTCGSFFLLSFFVATNPQKVNLKANKWLALFLFSIGCLLIDSAFSRANIYQKYPHLISVTDAFTFMVAPALYLSINYFVSPAKQFKKIELLHFLPALLIFLLQIPLYLQSEKEKLKSIDTPIVETKSNIITGIILLILPLTIYWVLSFRKLIKHQKNIRLFSSALETIDLAWLRYFLFGAAFMVTIGLNDITKFFPSLLTYSPLFYLGAAYYLTYFILKQGEIFSSKPEVTLAIKSLIDENEQIKSTKKQLLTEEQITILKASLSDLMNTKKPYLESTLSLPTLAQMMQISTHELSYLINEGFADNFFGFVNNYRVEESKRLLISPKFQHLSMVGIAFEAGFNSKTAFNTTFKKVTGLSPTEFLNQEK